MQAPDKCRRCGLDLGRYIETHCPQCGLNFAAKPPTAGTLLLDWMIGICGTLFVFSFVGWFALHMNSSSRAKLYEGAPYHATTFRVMSVQYTPATVAPDGAATGPIASAVGIVEGQRETMDVFPYIYPRSRDELMAHFPKDTIIPVYLFPTLRGVNRIQRVGVPPAEKYQEQTTWTTNRALPVVGGIGMLTALLVLGRFLVSRNPTAANC
jgi:hypothetical protein